MPNSLELTEQIANMNTSMLVVFDGSDIIVTNAAFNKFFGVASTEEYKRNFGAFVNNFVPHPSYFHAQKVEDGENWFSAILKLDEIDRVVSFLSQSHEPHAFSVSINQQVENINIVSFEDITQDLIKHSIRQDDMLVKWAQNKFLLAYLTDEVHKAKQIEEKLQNILKSCTIKDFSYSFDSRVQTDKESIATLLNKLSS